MEIVSKGEGKYVFKTKIEDTLINSIRRYVGQISVAAIDSVEISKNDSPLYDETLAHRLGLVPIKKGTKKEGKMKLSSQEKGFVYSGSLKGDFEVVYEKMPITLLSKGQEIEVVANVRMGKGQEHAKFSPGLINYRQVVEIYLDKEIAEKVKNTLQKVEIKQKGDKFLIIDDKEIEVSDICEGFAERNGNTIEVKPTEEIIVALESFGQIEVRSIFTGAVDALKKDLDEVSKKLKK